MSIGPTPGIPAIAENIWKVDRTSVEVFIDDGSVAYSNVVFPELGDQGISLFSDGGTGIKISVLNIHPIPHQPESGVF